MIAQIANNNMIVEFDGDKSGFSRILMKPGYFNIGFGRSNSLNNIDADYNFHVCRSNYHIFIVNGIEYSASDLNWSVEETTYNSYDLYGKSDTINNANVPVVRVYTASPLYIGNGRKIRSQEILYYFSPDGITVLKALNITLNASASNILQSIRILDFVGADTPEGRSDLQHFYFGRLDLGFNYQTIGEFTSEWSLDVGLASTLSRLNVYPNLLPDFNSLEWKDQATVVDSKTLVLNSGDNTYLTTYNAYPDDRKYYLIFDAQDFSGELRVSFSVSRNASKLDNESTTISITSSGLNTIQIPAGYGYAWLYVRFHQMSGSCKIYEPSVNYDNSDFSYAAPDGSILAHTNLKNCIRITSANPQNKIMTKTLSTNLFVSSGKGYMLIMRSLDNTHITDDAFRVDFQLADGTWIESIPQNMFIDWNETYPLGNAVQFNYWEDGIYGIPIPDGVDEIQAVRIKFLTSNSIDWVFDSLIVCDWQINDNGIGSDDRRRFGPSVVGIRQQDFALRGCHGIQYNQSTLVSERINITPNGLSTLTYSNMSGIQEVWYSVQSSFVISYTNVTDRGYELEIDASAYSEFWYPTYIRNIRTNESYRIKNFDDATKIIIADASSKEYKSGDLFRIDYVGKYTIPGSLYTANVGDGTVSWYSESSIYMYYPTYIKYTVANRSDDRISLVHGSSNHVNSTVRCLRLDPTISPPLLSNYSTVVLYDASNSRGSAIFAYMPVKTVIDRDLYRLTENLQTTIEDLTVLSRKAPITPVPVNYNLIPHVAFGGEQIAAKPLEYLTDVRQKFTQAGTDNAIVSAGSLVFLRDRDMGNWWYWSGALQDSAVDYIFATRQMLRNGASELTVLNAVSRYRYLCEVTTFAYTHNKRYPSHASVDYKGDQKFKRVWYYEESGGLYTAVTRGWSDFAKSYYNPIALNGKSYIFQYHYVLVIPAFWSITTSSSDWGLAENTVYDLMKRRITYLCENYDTDGIIISELIHYTEGFSDNDFILYNTWCQNNGYGVQLDWPRFHSNNYVDPDDSKIWSWKRYQIKNFLSAMTEICHSRSKFLSANVNVQNVIGIKNVNNEIWKPYDQSYNSKYGTWHVDTLALSMDRYGANYSELLDNNAVDFLYVWLYYRYSVFGVKSVIDFMTYFQQYKSRMLLTVGLFPKENPPSECEVVFLVKMLLDAGWNVAYAGYPPMLIQDTRWTDVWSKISGHIPVTTYDSSTNELVVNSDYAIEIPYYVKF